MAAYWLVKQEPTAYSWSDLEKERETEWNGVHNALALRHLRAMGVGDLALFYHSGSERACVGILRVVRGPEPDPRDARGSWTVRVRPVRRFRRAIPLAEIRNDRAFDGFDLVRISRLSVMPVSEDRWAKLMALEGEAAPAARRSTAGPRGRGRTSGSRRRAPSGRRRR
jgi:predicted RNA-binding protein with PUA-like domain